MLENIFTGKLEDFLPQEGKEQEGFPPLVGVHLLTGLMKQLCLLSAPVLFALLSAPLFPSWKHTLRFWKASGGILWLEIMGPTEIADVCTWITVSVNPLGVEQPCSAPLPWHPSMCQQGHFWVTFALCDFWLLTRASAGAIRAAERNISELTLTRPAWGMLAVGALLSSQGILGLSACACAETHVSLFRLKQYWVDLRMLLIVPLNCSVTFPAIMFGDRIRCQTPCHVPI